MRCMMRMATPLAQSASTCNLRKEMVSCLVSWKFTGIVNVHLTGEKALWLTSFLFLFLFLSTAVNFFDLVSSALHQSDDSD